MPRTRSAVIWTVTVLAMTVPLALAIKSPLLQWRDPVYIASGIAGVVAMIMLLLQPLLASISLPGINRIHSTRLHRLIGPLLVLAVVIHVVGLWITSPPDVVDALLFKSATPFSVWGVTAMWCIFLTAALAAYRKKFRTNLHTWKLAHKVLAAVIVAGSVIHAVLIDGTMESISKYAFCALLVGATFFAIINTEFANNKLFQKKDTT